LGTEANYFHGEVIEFGGRGINQTDAPNLRYFAVVRTAVARVLVRERQDQSR